MISAEPKSEELARKAVDIRVGRMAFSPQLGRGKAPPIQAAWILLACEQNYWQALPQVFYSEANAIAHARGKGRRKYQVVVVKIEPSEPPQKELPHA